MSRHNARDWADLYVNEVIHKYNPKFKIRPKSESRLFRFLAPVIKLINPTFFTTYTTTMFGTMWVPDNFFERPYIRVLKTCAHEGRHEYDRKRLPFGVFELMYTFPQNLSVLFLLLALMHSCWWFVPAILFLAPMPAPGRYHLEMKGYAMSRIWDDYVFKNDGTLSDEHVVHQMSALRTYYWCWPFKKWIYKDLDRPIDYGEPGFADVMLFLKKHSLA